MGCGCQDKAKYGCGEKVKECKEIVKPTVDNTELECPNGYMSTECIKISGEFEKTMNIPEGTPIDQVIAKMFRDIAEIKKGLQQVYQLLQ